MYGMGGRMTNASWMLVMAGLLEIGWAVGLNNGLKVSFVGPSRACLGVGGRRR
jgi:hypothetical protein